MSRITDLIKETKEVDPIPSSPRRPPVINLTIKTEDGRSYIWNFAAIYAARRAVDFLISDRSVKWIDDNTIRINDKVTVTTDAAPDGLSEVMEHEFSTKERMWSLSADHMRIGQSMFVAAEPSYIDDAPKTAAREERSEKPEKVKREPKAPKAERAPKPSGLISLPDLLSDTDIDPKEARNALRKLGTPKPDHGRWEFTKADADAIKSKIIKKVKELRK